MDRFFYRLQSFISKYRLVFSMLLLVYVGGVLWSLSNIQISENASLILPKSNAQDELTEILENISFSDRLFFNISLSDTTQKNTQALIDFANDLASNLEESSASEIQEIHLQVQDQSMEQISNYVLNNLPYLLEDDDYEYIDKSIEEEQLQKNFQKKYKTLLSPASSFLKKFIIQDPVGLSNKALERLRNFQMDEQISLVQNYLFTQDQKHLLFYIIPNQPASETKKNSILIENIEDAISKLSSESASPIKAEYFGAARVAVGNATQIKKDIILTVTIAVIFVILLIAFFYRSKRLYFIIFLPAALSVLTSIFVLFILGREISAIALGMGSILVGISIDYVLHLFTHFQHVTSKKQLLKDVSEPVLISATTTATAFFGLMIVSAPALQDLGLFAGISILFSALFTLTIIPVFLKKASSLKKSKSLSDSKLHRLVRQFTEFPFHEKKYLVLFILILTPVLYYFSQSVNFQGDMNSINFMDKKTLEAEKNLNSITQMSQRNIYVVSSDTNLQKALFLSEEFEKELSDLQNQGLILKHSSIKNLLPSHELQNERIDKWNSYWTAEKKSALFQQLNKIEKEYHFKEGTFAAFENMLSVDYSLISSSDEELIRGLFLNELVQSSVKGNLVVTQIKTTTENKSKLHQLLEAKINPGTYIIDKEYLTSKFVDDLKKDFQKLVNISLLLVLLIIWLSFGRIELAFITYLPLMMSWVWTMGLMSLFGLEFNIVNIIITTFIFGLGIDYSIFITRGLIQEYKYGVKNSTSFKTSILFSAITTIVGVGVLIFAQHPALRSMAAVTVIGLMSVLLISFTIQPLIFNWLAYVSKGKKRLVPVTSLNLLGSIIALIVFSLGSLLNTIAGFFLIILTRGKSETARLWFHHLLRWTTWFMVFVMFNVKKKVSGWEKEKFEKPSVIISNHQSHIDIMLMLMLHPKIILLTNDWVQRNFFYGKIVKMANFYPILDSLHLHIDLLQKKVDQGYSIMIFPEGTRSVTGKIGRFHKGAFFLAEKLKLDILPIILHGPGHCITKGEPYLKGGRIDVVINERVSYKDLSFGEHYAERSKAFRKWYQQEFHALEQQVVTPKYMRKRVELNYIYKGPILEWYGRIKMNFEKNYSFFHEQIPLDAKIVDLGCGNGFMDYMLMMLSPARQVIGVDYDEDKISVAQNCNAYTQFGEGNIQFFASDLMNFDFQKADVYVMADVLHYMPIEEQEWVIKQAAAHLNPKGQIIIRDADSNLAKKHRGTKFSEWQSTKLMGFNKTKDDSKKLYFSSAKKTQNLLESLGLQVHIVDETKLNSNVILVACKK